MAISYSVRGVCALESSSSVQHCSTKDFQSSVTAESDVVNIHIHI